MNPAMKGQVTKCRVHGGKSLKGAASPVAKTLQYSKYLPGNLQGRYEEMRSDPELLSLEQEISLTRTRISDLLTRLETRDSAGLMADLNDAFDDFRKAQAKKDTEAAGAALTDLGVLIKRGAGDYSLWAELQGLMESLRRLSDTERRRKVDMRVMLEIDRVMTVITAASAAFRSALKEFVDDENTQRAVLNRAAELLDRVMRQPDGQ